MTEAEMNALEAKFCNDTGFNYLRFLEELQPTEPPQLMYRQRLQELRLTNAKAKLPERSGTSHDQESVLLIIKKKVRRRVDRIKFKFFKNLNILLRIGEPSSGIV